ncbi:hypothetical protein BGX26_002871 [Mortierella sp. AD094]|nr:hypothetical protein BGX26_002871 [Mortierella sp. AD094]
MTSDNVTAPHRQAFRARSSSTAWNIPARLDPKTGQHIVLWREIQRAFKNAECIVNNGDFVPFLLNDDFEEIVPQRIAYMPGVTLEVVTSVADNTVDTTSEASLERTPTSLSELPRIHGEAKINTAIPLAEEIAGTECSQPLVENIVEEEKDMTSLHIGALAISDVGTNIINTNDKIMELRSSFNDHQQLCQSFSQAYMLGQMNQAIVIADQAKGIKDAMNEHFGDMRVDMGKNKALQEQILQMQRQAEENQKQMMDMQQKLEENQRQMMKMQQQSLDRLAIPFHVCSSSCQSLHECEID